MTSEERAKAVVKAWLLLKGGRPDEVDADVEEGGDLERLINAAIRDAETETISNIAKSLRG